MEIEVGNFVRNEDGYIWEIKNIKDLDNIFIDEDEKLKEIAGETVFGDDVIVEITKHSKNIIDLVEVGDYVNGYRVVAIMEDMETGEIHLEMTSDYTNEIIGDCTIYNDDINSIVTKEQFAQAEYKIKEDK